MLLEHIAMDVPEVKTEELGLASSRVQPLLFYCQRVAASHLDAIDSFAGLPFELVAPILESCTAQQLLRFEEDAPELRDTTFDIWKKVCIREFPAAAEQYERKERDEPTSWREEFFDLQSAAHRRLEEAALRLRSKRQGDEERKEEKKAKFIDRKPPAKRPRWGLSAPTKTLMTNARSKATLVAKNNHHVLSNPKGLATIPNAPSTRMPVLPPPSRTMLTVTSVRTVPVVSTLSTSTARVTMRRQPTLPSTTSSLSSLSSYPASTFNGPNPTRVLPPSSASTSTSRSSSGSRHTSPSSTTSSILTSTLSQVALSTVSSVTPSPSPKRSSVARSDMTSTRTDASARPVKLPPPRKDKTPILFMPKHKAYSQLPPSTRGVSNG